MKINFTFICLLFFSITSWSQNFEKEWKQVYKLEIKGLNKSALAKVEKIYEKAKKKKSDENLYISFFYLSKFYLELEENGQQKVIKNLQNDITLIKSEPYASLLQYLYADLLQKYQSKNWNLIRNNKKSNDSLSFENWNANRIEIEITKAQKLSIANKKELSKLKINDYKKLFITEGVSNFREPSVFDFLRNEYLKRFRIYYYKSNDVVADSIMQQQLYAIDNSFNAKRLSKISDSGINSNFLDNSTLFESDTLEVDYYEKVFERINYYHSALKNYDLYLKSIDQLEKVAQSNVFKSYLQLSKATAYHEKATKTDSTNYNKLAVELCDSILQDKSNRFYFNEIEDLKNTITSQYLKVSLKKSIYENENTRAYLEYKNIDTFTIKYYKIDYKKEQTLANSDSLVKNYSSENAPFYTQKVILDNKKDYFNYTTEIILDKIPLGNYLTIVEFEKETILNKEKVDFQFIKVTNTIVLEDQNDTEHHFYLLDRKTGEPIQNAIVRNFEKAVLTDKMGKASFLKKVYDKKVKYETTEKYFFIKGKDTLIENKSHYFLESEVTKSVENDEFEAKSMVFFDRGIYRPGQKVFYKGIVIQKKNGVKSVVPNLTVFVSIENADYDTVSEFTVTTNEYGSFSGEFDIPKNGVTGEYTITISDSDYSDDDAIYEKDTAYYDAENEEHLFWDYVDYDKNDFTFQVEEYKKPTFEITFDQIKENLTFEDTVNFSGNAKSLAGSNLTGVTVKYTLKKNIYFKNYNYSNDYEEDLDYHDEVKTDENGNFTISWKATTNEIPRDSINQINYTVNVTVIDANGETITADEHVTVGKKMLSLKVDLPYEIIKEESNYLTINATTLNNYPIEAKGTVKILYVNETYNKKERQFPFPEIQSITKENFEKLFPLELYEFKKSEEIEIKTISFNTALNKNIDLSFLKEAKNGTYIFRTVAYDQNNNEITTQTSKQVLSNTNIANDKEFFTYKNISKKNDAFYEIEFQSSLPKVTFICSYYEGNNKVSDQIITIIDGKAFFKIKKEKKEKETAFFSFIGVYDDAFLEETLTIKNEETDKKIEFETVSFRNKIEPGSTENWSFKILDKQLEAEVLATMYDTSLDQFSTTYWDYSRFLNFYENYYNLPKYIKNSNSHNIISFTIKHQRDNTYKYYFKSQTILNRFGLDFNQSSSNYEKKKYLEKIEINYIIPKNAKLYKGIVSDVNGPLPSANVLVKGTNYGTTTDFDGNYTIAAQTGDVLVFSFVGMEDKEITVGSSNNIDVVLEEGKILSELVVTALGVTKSSDVTGSFTRITSAEISAGGNADIVRSLAGKVSGLQISSTSDGTIQISVGNNKNAIVIVDGEIVSANAFGKLDPFSIESVTVLKPKEAIAIYGAKGINGALVVLTKRAIIDISGIEARSNFKETAYFYPHLKTDEKGVVSFTFTTPDNLTKWKMRLFAHNKNAEFGIFVQEIISQKELMVMPNMPRFVREKDKITLISKIVNLSTSQKNGLAVLYLFDAATGNKIDVACANTNSTKNFSTNAKQTTVVSWTITIPEGISGLQYKIVAKSGNVSDGEENILPVLSNRILVTESKPIWLRENTKKEYVFENLKNASSSLQNHQFTIEYTSNPTWFAIQSLPYLMEYEHECSEQTFARFYANTIAKKIIIGNPKISALFEKWKTETPKSKLTLNEELKSVLLNETPWFFDAQSEEEKNKKVALLFDLEKLKNTETATLGKLKEKQLASGGFAWFDGGKESVFITRHILAGLGHLNKLFPENTVNYKDISKAGVLFLDKNFISEKLKYTYNDVHYLYTRSFYLQEYPLDKKTDSLVKIDLAKYKKNWLTESLYNKAQMALIYNRYGDSDFAKMIIAHLKDSSALNEEIGMYWINNKNSFYWYQSSIETQAMLIEAFAEVTNDTKAIDAMKVWLIKQKQHKNWPSTKSTSEAIYALLLQGSDFTNVNKEVIISIGDKKIKKEVLNEATDATGYVKYSLQKNEITNATSKVEIKNNSSVPGYGGIYWQYFENIENIKSNSNDGLTIKKELFKNVNTTVGDTLLPIQTQKLTLGDLVTIRLTVTVSEDLSYLHLKDLRASCFEPVDVISTYNWNPTSHYKSTKDIATHFFFDSLKKGKYTFEYQVRVNNAGEFNDGIATLQSMYSPEFSTNSTSTKIKTFENK